MKISHLYESDGQWHLQSNEEHCANVANLCANFASEFGMSDFGRILGLLHDKGKESDAFQQYIRYASGYDTTERPREEHNHAYVGGILANSLYGKALKDWLTNPIISHHTGLHNSDEVMGEINKPLPKGVDSEVDKIKLSVPKLNFKSENVNYLPQLLFSCLVDADYLDTEKFMDGEKAQSRKKSNSLSELLPKLDIYLAKMKQEAPKTELNNLRNKIQARCNEMSQSGKGFYSLTVPTGGGKTLSSILWAIKHAIKNGQKRIIIAIPYTSIIVQTASILKNIFGEDNVLEHHSNVVSNENNDENLNERIRLASENWDYPIIVTTNVRLFESMYSNKPSACRKLHNIVNSVIILDEVQTLPAKYLKPIVNVLKAYNQLFGVSVLFTTASQPVLSGQIKGTNESIDFQGVDKITEIIPQEFNLHDKLRRVRLNFISEGLTYDQLAKRLLKHKRVLCIVNTRKDALEIFSRLPKEGKTYHLSRNMCAAHIMSTIEEIKETLKDDNEAIIRVVSTQLVEAGVDIDFPIVFRQEIGLDSVLQAAGRCNREGKLSISDCFVFSLSGEGRNPFGEMAVANNARLNIKGEHDCFAPETMSEYFRQFYSRQDNFDDKDISGNMGKGQYKQVAEDFHLIEDKTTNIIVNYGDSMKLVKQLESEIISKSTMKLLGRFTVSVNDNSFQKLIKSGLVREAKEGIFVIDDEKQYDANVGLLFDSHWENDMLII